MTSQQPAAEKSSLEATHVRPSENALPANALKVPGPSIRRAVMTGTSPRAGSKYHPIFNLGGPSEEGLWSIGPLGNRVVQIAPSPITGRPWLHSLTASGTLASGIRGAAEPPICDP